MTPHPFMGLLPAVAYVLVAMAAGTSAREPRRPGSQPPDRTPLRLTALRAAVVVGAVGVLSTEALSAGRLLTRAAVAAVWLGVILIAGGTAVWRRSLRSPGVDRAAAVGRWRALPVADRALIVGTGVAVLAELVLAIASAPNTYDSQTYHLPRIEHWVAQRSVEPYPVSIHRQVTYPPGAEYLLLHLRLLTGGDALAALVQWLAGVLCLICVTRLTAQLGGGRRAQLLAGFVFATTPAVVLEASSTQVDLVVAAWVAGAATLVLDGVGRRPATAPGPVAVVLLGLVTGLVAVTKSPGLLVIAPLLAWWGCAWLRRGGAPLRTRIAGVAASVGTVAVLTAACTGPYLWRTYREFGNPLGPEYMRTSISMQRHDPAAVLVNALRQAHTLLDTPIRPLRDASANSVIWVAHRVGVDPQDKAITFDDGTFPAVAWYPSEGKAAFPIQALLLFVGTVGVLVAPGRRGPAARRLFGTIIVLAAISHVATVKWSPWSNRLALYLVVLAAPLAGLWLAAALRPLAGRAAQPPVRHRLGAALAGTVVLALVTGGAAGWLSAVLGWPRRLVGRDSALLLDDWDSRFVTRPEWAGQYAAAGAAVRDSGARRIGIVEGGDSWEYPWWLLLRGRELVALQSQLPHRPPPPSSTVDAVVCTTPLEVCLWYVPAAGWSVHQLGTVTYALPPG